MRSIAAGWAMAGAMLLALAAVGIATGAARAQEVEPERLPPPERIAGHVFQATADAELPEELDVILEVRDEANIPVDEYAVQIGPEGEFEFSGYPINPEYSYRLVTTYGNLQQTIRVEDILNPNDVILRIYETTSTLDDVSATTHVTIVPRVDGKGQIMGVLELVEISNGGDKTFVTDLENPAPGGVPQLLRFSLPEGYSELTVDSSLPSGTVLEIDRGFALSNAVPPGDFQVLYSYVIEYDGDELVLERSLPFDVHEYRVLMPPKFGTVEAEGFVASDDQMLGETNYRVMYGSGFQGGERLEIRITGLPQPSFFQQLQNFVGGSAWATIGTPLIAAAAMALLLGYVIFYRGRRRVAMAGGMTRAELVAAIAELDARREAGEVGDEEYARERGELVEQALAAEEPGGREGPR